MEDPQETLRRWSRWVNEVSRGDLLTEDEMISVYWTRDELEDKLHALPPEDAVELADLVDPLDAAFARATVASDVLTAKKPSSEGRWWWGRVPLDNRSRLFLLRRDMPRLTRGGADTE